MIIIAVIGIITLRVTIIDYIIIVRLRIRLRNIGIRNY